jgi:regulatory protein
VTEAAGDAFRATYRKALEALTRRARSTAELERWLTERDHAREHIELSIARLKSLGYLDDAQYARAFARSRAIARGMSRRRIRAELVHRGVARELIDAAIAEVMEEEGVDERALVEAAAAKKLRGMTKLEPEVRRRRLYGFLARRGYAADLVRETVAKLTRSGE